jgi:RHS repeat-associated protein
MSNTGDLHLDSAGVGTSRLSVTLLALISVLMRSVVCRRRSVARRVIATTLMAALVVTGMNLHQAESAFAGEPPTEVSGDVTSSTTWTLDQSPYIVTGEMRVMPGVTLTIEPGVVVRFRVPASGAPYQLLVYGTLIAEGTESQRITFTSDRDPTVGGTGSPTRRDWRGIRLATLTAGQTPSATSVIRHANLRYGAYAGSCLHGGIVEVADRRPVRIEQSSFSEIGSAAIYLQYTSPDPSNVQITGNTVRGCQGISALLQASFTAQDNDIETTGQPIYTGGDTNSTVVLTGNRFAGYAAVINEHASVSHTIRYNDFVSGYSGNVKDARWNWWNRVIPLPGCYGSIINNLEPNGSYGFNVPVCGPAHISNPTPYYLTYGPKAIPALTTPVYATSQLPGGSFAASEWFGGGNSASAAQPCGTNTGHPIECSSGNFWHTFEGLAVPGRGMPLNFGFTYNAQAAAQDGPLGFGWTHSYAARLEVDGANAVVHQENGAQVPFTFDGTVWKTPSRFDATLAFDGTVWTFTRRGVEQFTFDQDGRLTSQRRLTDPASYATTISYPSGDTMVVTDVAGRTLTFSLSNGRIVAVSDTASPARQLAFDYNAAGELVSYTDATSGTWVFGYDGAGDHRMTTMRKPSGQDQTDPPLLTNTYDDQGRVVAQTDWADRTTTFEYTTPPGANVTTTLVTDPRGNQTMKVFGNGVLIGKIEGFGTASESSWGYEIDPNTLGVTRMIDPAGTSTTATYDARGRVLSMTDQLKRKSSWTYDEFNNVLTESSPNPSTTGPATITATYTYDAGRLTSVSRPLYTGPTTFVPQQTVYTRGDTAHPDDVTAITDPEGATTSFTYDSATGDLASVTDPEGSVTSYGHDGIGRVTSTVAPNGNEPDADPSEWTTTFAYNANNQPTEVVEPVDATTTATTTRTYDVDGNLASVTDPNNHTTSYTYDAAGQVVEVHRPDGSVLANEYWPDGQLKAQLDGSGTPARSFEHDAQGRLVSSTDALGNATTFGYDIAGNLAWKAEPGGSCPTGAAGTGCTRYGYDAAQQLTGITYSDGTTPNVTYAYGATGQRTTMTDGAGTSTYAYDSLGRLISHTDGAGAAVGYAYDLRGSLTSLTYPELGAVTYTWDDAGRAEAVTDWAGRTYTYDQDANGNTTSIGFPTGTGTTDAFAYDHTGRMSASTTNHDGTRTAMVQYRRDPAGAVTSTTQTGLPGSDQVYGYDALDQLCYAAGSGSGTCDQPPTGATSYTYDPADNLTATTTAATQRFNTANQLCWTSQAPATGTCEAPPADATTYAYDNRGNRTTTTPATGDPTTYAYDQAGRLTATTGAVTSSYTYDGDGLRTSSTIEGATSTFTWNHAGAHPLAMKDGTNAYVYGPNGLPLAHQDIATGEIAYYHRDQLGSTRLLTAADGTTLGTATYDPHGTLAASNGETTPLGFAGQYTDAHTGLQYLRARYYDPTTGQLLTRDPLESVTGEPYGYVGNDPINNTDPTGMCPWCLAAIGGAIGGAAIDLGTQMLGNALSGCGLTDNIDWGSVAISGAVGGLTGAGAGYLVNSLRGTSAIANTARTADHVLPIGPAPNRVWTVLNRVDAKGAPMPGYKGGKVFENSQRRLPQTPGVTYREWDVNPYIKGVNRGMERMVTGSDGSAYFTSEHYATFMLVRGPIG